MHCRLILCAATLLAATASAADSPVGKVLLQDDFEANSPGARPAGWGVHVDEGNDVVVVETPALGRRAVRFTDVGGSVWKPMIQGQVSGEAGSFLKLDFDWRLNGVFDDHKKAFTVVVRGTENIEVAAVALGGPGGVAVRQKGLGWLSLRVPMKTDQWNHLTLIADPISWGERGAFTVVITQGEERLVFANVPFCPPRDRYPREYWFSSCFSLAGGGAAGAEKEAYLDNVKVEVVSGRRESLAQVRQWRRFWGDFWRCALRGGGRSGRSGAFPFSCGHVV